MAKLKKFTSFEELKASKSETERSEEQILKSHEDLEIFIEELKKGSKPNEELKKALQKYKDYKDENL